MPLLLPSFGSWIPYLCVFLAYLDFMARIILFFLDNTSFTHQVKAASSRRPCESANSATWTGKDSFMSLRGSQDVEPSFHCTHKYHSFVVRLLWILPFWLTIKRSSDGIASSSLLTSIISSNSRYLCP